MTEVTELESLFCCCYFQFWSSERCVRVCVCAHSSHTETLAHGLIFLLLFFSQVVHQQQVLWAIEVFYFHLICRSFILFPGNGQTVAVPLRSWEKKRMPERGTLTWSSGSPSPFRNLLTPLGPGSGYDSRYSATRNSNRPGTQNMIKKDESHCSSIHVNPVLGFF